MPKIKPSLTVDTDSASVSENPKAPFAQVLLEIIEDQRISAGAFRLYALLIGLSRGFGACWPSQATLATRLGITQRTVRNWLKELEATDYIDIEHRYALPGQEQSNIYHLKKLVPRQGERVRHENTAPCGTVLPETPEQNCQSQRNEISAYIHELDLHDKENINTQEAEPRLTDMPGLEGGCEDVIFANKFNDQETKTEQAQSTIKLIEQQLKFAGVSTIRAKKAAQLAIANGRTSRYIEQWQRWIATQSHIQNPAAYLLSRVLENTDVPRGNRPNRDRLSSWSKALSQSQPASVKLLEADNDLADAVENSPASEQPLALKLVVDNTVHPPTRRSQDPWDYPEEFPDMLRLVVDNHSPCDNAPAGTNLLAVSDKVPEDTFSSLPRQDDLSRKKLEAENNSGSTPDPVKPPDRVAPRIEVRLKELLVQRDERIKRVKRLEVIGDTLYVAFWFKHEAEEGIGQNWLADAKWFYPEVHKVELA